MRWRHRFSIGGAVVTACLTILAMAAGIPAAQAAPSSNVITVTTLADSTSTGDQCSLPEAIDNINSVILQQPQPPPPFPACATITTGMAIIQFSVSGTMTLTSPLPTITWIGGADIDGTGQNVTISGNNKSQIFITHSTLVLNDLTLSDGLASGGNGGAVDSSATELTITNCTFDNDSATGSGGQGSGGAIYSSQASLSISGSTFQSDSAVTDGGAVLSGGAPFTITSSTFVNDTAGDAGGAVEAQFGAIVFSSNFSSDNTTGPSANGTGSTSNGGAIDVSGGAVQLTSDTFAGDVTFNDGGAVNLTERFLNRPILTIMNKDTFTTDDAFFGGAVAATDLGSTLRIAASTFAHNEADFAGALAIEGAGTQIANSTFADNSAAHEAGAVNAQSPTVIAATTFSGNSAASGASVFPSINATVTLHGTILAGAGGGGRNCATAVGGAIADGGYNISDDNSCQLTSPHSKSNTNPGLAPAGLANNGGPTQTIALQAGSPAIDAIPPAACTAADGSLLPTDQRGYARLADGNGDGVAGCDVGAYEFGSVPRGEVQPGPTFTVSTTADSHGRVCFLAKNGRCSLRDAIMMANAYALQHPKKTATVQLAVGKTYALTAIDNKGTSGANALPVVLGRVTVQGAGATVERSASAPTMRLLQVGAGGVLTVVNTKLAGGHTARNGGVLLNAGTLTLTRSVVRDAAAGMTGGGLYNTGTATVTSSTFFADTAAGNGGAILNRGHLTVANSTTTGNKAASGGAIASSAGGVKLINATLSADAASKGAREVTIGGGSVSFANTIVGHAVGTTNCAFAKAATHTDAGHNLDSGTSCKFGRNHHSLSHVSPGLGALANYGGPTPTLQLKAGSAAINAASNTVCKAAPINNLDQRGIKRITATDPTCDIGAFEHRR